MDKGDLQKETAGVINPDIFKQLEEMMGKDRSGDDRRGPRQKARRLRKIREEKS